MNVMHIPHSKERYMAYKSQDTTDSTTQYSVTTPAHTARKLKLPPANTKAVFHTVKSPAPYSIGKHSAGSSISSLVSRLRKKTIIRRSEIIKMDKLRNRESTGLATVRTWVRILAMAGPYCQYELLTFILASGLGSLLNRMAKCPTKKTKKKRGCGVEVDEGHRVGSCLVNPELLSDKLLVAEM